MRSLNFSYIRNGTRELAEFEVSEPVCFRIVVEKRSDPEVSSSLILPSIKPAKGSTLDIWFDFEGSGQDEIAISSARKFLRSLVSSLPTKPWDGLRFRESAKEKKKWQEFTS